MRIVCRSQLAVGIRCRVLSHRCHALFTASEPPGTNPSPQAFCHVDALAQTRFAPEVTARLPFADRLRRGSYRTGESRPGRFYHIFMAIRSIGAGKITWNNPRIADGGRGRSPLAALR
ncbi:MAG: hypothetical protein CMP06_08985 [Xanthomonadales bacterium]|nr:hypothetical protein [Xanthomonadales bacterium]